MVQNPANNQDDSSFILSEKSYRFLFDKMNNAFLLGRVVLDAKGNPIDVQIEFINQKLEELLKHKCEKVIGHNLSEIMPVNHPEQFLRFCNVGLTGESIAEEFFSVAFNGFFRGNAYSPLKNYVAVVLDDITSIKQSEAELRESREKFSKIFNRAPVLISITDLKDGTFIEVNDFAIDYSGFSYDEVIGHRSTEIGWISFESRAILTKKLMETGKIDGLEVTLKRKDGKELFAIVNGEKIILNNKECLLLITTDITERKQAEEAYKVSEEKYRTLVQYSSDPIFSFNPDESYRFVNDIFAKTFGKDPQDIIGKTPHSLFPHEEAENRLRLVRQVFKTGLKGEIEVKVVTPAGKEMYFITIVDPIKDEEGKILWVTCISKNITERKLSEQALQDSERKLFKLNADKDLFMSVLAHDLKSPFNGLLGLSGVLVENIRKYEINEIENLVNYINQSALSTYNLLEDLLLWIRSQSGKMPYNPQNIRIADSYKNVIEILSPIAREKNITIRYKEDEEIVVFADSEMLKTILRNLITNAIKFTNLNGVITIYAEKKSDNVTVSVSDNGVGIEPDDLSRLFDISIIHSSHGTEGEKGTGLGLFLCKEFIDKHSGKIWVESEVGKGSLFRFSLPDKKYQLR